MQTARVAKEALAAEIGARRVTLKGMGGSAAGGALGRAAEAMAEAGLKKAGQVAAGPRLQFPPCCCNCMTETRVRPVESTSIVNRGVAYLFRFAIPHCSACADTANRKRLGFMGLLAAFLAISVPVGIVMLGVGAATNRDWIISASLLVAPALGVGLPWAWRKLRRPRPGQASRYQAVYVSGIDVELSGVPTGFTLAFENDAYATRFSALNRAPKGGNA
jgi:hypothetical protein